MLYVACMCIISLFSAKEFENTHRSGINFKLFGVSLKQLEMLPQDEFVNYYNPEMKIPLISFQKLYGAYLKGNVRKYTIL